MVILAVIALPVRLPVKPRMTLAPVRRDQFRAIVLDRRRRRDGDAGRRDRCRFRSSCWSRRRPDMSRVWSSRSDGAAPGRSGDQPRRFDGRVHFKPPSRELPRLLGALDQRHDGRPFALDAASTAGQSLEVSPHSCSGNFRPRSDARPCDPLRIESHRPESLDCVDQSLDRLLAEQHARPAVANRLRRAAASIGDDRPAAGLGLDRHDAEILFAGKHQRLASGVVMPKHGKRLRPEHSDRSGRPAARIAFSLSPPPMTTSGKPMRLKASIASSVRL